MTDFRIRMFKPYVNERAVELTAQALRSGWIGEGPRVEEFEEKLQERFGFPYCIGLNSGTSAIRLALAMSDVGPGDEVLSVAQSCTATNTPILEQFAKPIFVDIQYGTGNIDPGDIEHRITEKTKAIIVVHWAGYPCDMDETHSIAAKYNLPVIEDGAHALGATYKGSPVGSLSDFTCFTPNAPIVTEKGIKKIKDITIGDRVLTSDGTYQKVLGVLEREYLGDWTRIHGALVHFIATSEHPVLVRRGDRDLWLQAKDVAIGDSFYAATNKCTRCHSGLVPIYGKVCPNCYRAAQNSRSKREKLSEGRKNHKARKSSRLIHHKKWVEPQMKRFESEGFRVIPLAHVFPDFLAIKDGRVIAVEVESTTTVKLSKEDKYSKILPYKYDDVIWITRKPKFKTTRYCYERASNLARVPVRGVVTAPWLNCQGQPSKRKVYNLTVDGNHTYFAYGMLVHNCFSLQAIKQLSTGDGGLLTVLTQQHYDEARRRRWFGIDRRNRRRGINGYYHWDQAEVGYKYQMNDVAASIGLGNFEDIDWILSRRKEIADKYYSELNGVAGITLFRKSNDRTSGHWLFTIHVERRDDFCRMMSSRGIEVSVCHIRNDVHSIFGPIRKDLPNTDRYSKTNISIPLHNHLSDSDVAEVIATIKSGW